MKFIIVGCGRMGAGLAKQLTEQGQTVTVIDKSQAAFDRLGSQFKGKTLTGVGFDREVLLEAGIEKTDGLAAVANSDEVNAITARIARQIYRVPQVVARLYDPRKAEVYRRLGIQIINHNAWGIGRIADLLVYSPLDPVFSLGNGEVDIVEAEIPKFFAGKKISDLEMPGQIVVLAIGRNGKTFLTSPGTFVNEGDQVYMAVADHAVSKLKSLLNLD